MAIDVGGTPPGPSVIELSALFGQFRIPGSRFTVRFASTFANATMAGHQNLLAELMPMRDRVDAGGLHDLTALLQRDLNDRRVAKELIPYLSGEGVDAASKIGFFPAVLAVLIPTDYLQQRHADGSVVAYPSAESDAGGSSVEYKKGGDGHYSWKVERYKAGGVDLPVGVLRVNPGLTDIVVLDGQHRSNAFRFLSGAFDPSKGIYREFYKDIARPDSLPADLPVTIIWFEADDPKAIKPGLISRQLFVDVNNTANQVSAARTILLDDRSVSAVATQVLYNSAAAEGFETAKFSLLHSAFDMDSDVADERLPAFALTSPEIVEAAYLWLLLGTQRYDFLSSWKVDRLRAQRNSTRFALVMGKTDGIDFDADDEEKPVQFLNGDIALEYRDEFKSKITPLMLQLFNGLKLLKGHYEAAEETRAWVISKGDTTEILAWDKIFTGGEGLYWTFRGKGVPVEDIYRKATEKIERIFKENRARNTGLDQADADQVYRSFATKAFQVAFVMAASFLASKNVANGVLVEAAELLTTALNRYTEKNWNVIFRQVRPLIVRGDTAPKVWPAYRNLLVRMFDEKSWNLVEDGSDDLIERYVYAAELKKAALTLAEEDSDDAIDDAAKHARTIRDRISAIFEEAGLFSPWFNSESAIEFGKKRFIENIEAAL